MKSKQPRTDRTFFGLSAHTYHDRMERSRYLAPSKVSSALKEHIKPNTPIKVLDIGTGTALAAQAVSETFHNAAIHGADISTNMMAQDTNCLVTHTQADLSKGQWPFDHEEFDAIISCGATEFIGNLPHIISEAGRVCKTRGTLALTFLKLDDYAKQQQILAWERNKSRCEEGKVQIVSEPLDNIKKWFIDSGMAIKDCTEFYAYGEKHLGERVYNLIIAEKLDI